MLNPHAAEILCVRGNCDCEVDQMVLDFPVLADYGFLLLEGRAAYLTHGHVINKAHPLSFQKGDILLHGHTHIPACEDCGDFTYLNPGSVSIPKKKRLGTQLYDLRKRRVCLEGASDRRGISALFAVSRSAADGRGPRMEENAMRKKRILTVLLVSMALAALLGAGCAEEEIGPAAPLVPAQTDEQPPASEPDESTVPEEPESEEEPEAQPDVGALMEAYLQTGGDAEKEALFAHPEEAAAEAMRGGSLRARRKSATRSVRTSARRRCCSGLWRNWCRTTPPTGKKELDYSYLWERLAGMFQFYSAHYRMDGADWIAEHAPRRQYDAGRVGGDPELRLDATACEAPVNYGVLVNARRIFGAVLSGKVQWLADHSFPNAQLWPLEGFSGTETGWTLTQEDSGEVTLTFTPEGENGKTGTLRYAPGEAEKAVALQRLRTGGVY